MVSFLLVVSQVSAAITDPFDKTRRQQEVKNNSSQTVKKNTALSSVQGMVTSCHGKKEIIAAQTAFKDLNIIGVFLSSKNKKLLFLDAQEKLQTASLGDILSQEKLQVESISMQKIRFQQWKNPNNCQQVETIEVKL